MSQDKDTEKANYNVNVRQLRITEKTKIVNNSVFTLPCWPAARQENESDLLFEYSIAHIYFKSHIEQLR